MLYLTDEEKFKFDPSAFMKTLMLITVVVTVSVVLIMLAGRDYIVKKDTEKPRGSEYFISNPASSETTTNKEIILPNN